MKHGSTTSFTLILASILASASLVHADDVRPLTAAVLDFKDGSEDLAGTGASVAALLQAKLTVDSQSPLVERAELNEVMSEQELTLTESVAPGQAAKVGQLTGAEVLVSGRVFAMRDRVHLVAKAISTSTGRVYGVTSDYDRQGNMDAAVALLSSQIAKILVDKRAELAGNISLEDRQLESLKRAMKHRKGPKIAISIKEEVLHAPAPDPAAATELGRALQAAGWTVVASDNEAELVVSGEALAETGTRRGNLWFVRARLEFVVKDASGKVLKKDRVVVGNIDIAEAVGNKGALQKAGLLASTLVADVWIAETHRHPGAGVSPGN